MALGGNNNELACVYAALICHDEGIEASATNIAAILKAANIETEAYWPTLFAKLVKGKNIGDMLTAGGGGGPVVAAGGAVAAPTGGAAPAGGDAPAKAAPEPEPEEEEEEMGFDLFD
mmetsp:Transcript_42360/g.88523  ORF Transcript_42360/g.88523 Transcript_42360/m.88523 type:complete len:117 (-) Transcript_42360:306-656(-)